MVEKLVPVKGVTLAFAAFMCAFGIGLVVLSGAVIARLHIQSEIWKRPDYDDL